MRILMTTDTVGGVWTFTEELASGLLRRGSAVCLVAIGPAASDSQRAWCDAAQSRWRGFRYEELDAPLEWMSNNSTAYAAAAPSLLALAADFEADIFHSNQFCFGALPLEIPVVVTAHSDVFSWARACRGGYLPASEWLTQYTALVTNGIAGADSIVTPTHWMAGALASSFTLPRPPSVIYNGRTRPPFQYRPRKRQAVTAGRLWDEAKNIVLLAAVHSPMPLLVVGKTTYNGVTFDRGLANLSLLGTLSPRELFTLFYESAIYICTSRYEPFGLAPLEAALCGCAVLAFDIPSMREVWGPAALYFDSPNSLTSLLRRLDAEPPLLADAQQRSAARASFFAAERMVDSYHLLFQQALARSEDAVNAA